MLGSKTTRRTDLRQWMGVQCLSGIDSLEHPNAPVRPHMSELSIQYGRRLTCAFVQKLDHSGLLVREDAHRCLGEKETIVMETLGAIINVGCRITGGRGIAENDWAWGTMVSLRYTPASRGRRNGMRVRKSDVSLSATHLSLTRNLVKFGPSEPRHFSITKYVLDNVLYLKIDQIQESKCKA